MPNGSYWPEISAAFSSYREDGTSDTDSSDTESVVQEAPRGPGSPMEPALPNLDDPVKALVDAFDIKSPDDLHRAREFVNDETNAFRNEVQAALQNAAAVNYGEYTIDSASQAQYSDIRGITPVRIGVDHKVPTAPTFSFHTQAPPHRPGCIPRTNTSGTGVQRSLFDTTAFGAPQGTGLFSNVPIGISQGTLFGKPLSGGPPPSLFGINTVNQPQGTLFGNKPTYQSQGPLFESNPNHQSQGPLFGTNAVHQSQGSRFGDNSSGPSPGLLRGQNPPTELQVDEPRRPLFGNIPVDISQRADQSHDLAKAANYAYSKTLFHHHTTKTGDKFPAKIQSFNSQAQYAPGLVNATPTTASTAWTGKDFTPPKYTFLEQLARSKGNTFEYTWDAEGPSDQSIRTLFQQLLPSNHRLGENLQKLTDPFGFSSELKINGLKVSSSRDFVEAVDQSLLEDGKDQGQVSSVLTTLYGFIIMFVDSVVVSTTEKLACKMDLLRFEKQAEKMSSLPYFLHNLNSAKEKARNGLTENEAGFIEMQNDLISKVIAALVIMSGHTDVDKEGSLPRLVDAELRAARPELRNGQSESRVLRTKMKSLQETCDATKQAMADKVKKLHSTHRNQINTRLSECTRDHEDALRKLKEQYSDRIDDAEAKVRLHKQAAIRNGELEETIKKLEDEKAEVLLAKAAVEKELQGLEAESRIWQSYKDAYAQIKAENEQLQGELNDVVAERDELRTSDNAPSSQSMNASAQDTSVLHTAGGTLQSYDQDLGLLETYWSRQEQFAEVEVRDTAAAIEDADAEINEIMRQLRVLVAPNVPRSEDEDEVEIERTGFVDTTRETAIGAPASEEVRHSQLLDTLARPLPSEGKRPQAPNLTQAPYLAPTAPRAMRTNTWADKAAIVQDGKEIMGHGLVNLSYQGHGVSTVKGTSRANLGTTQGYLSHGNKVGQLMTGLDGRVYRRLDRPGN